MRDGSQFLYSNAVPLTVEGSLTVEESSVAEFTSPVTVHQNVTLQHAFPELLGEKDIDSTLLGTLACGPAFRMLQSLRMNGGHIRGPCELEVARPVSSGLPVPAVEFFGTQGDMVSGETTLLLDSDTEVSVRIGVQAPTVQTSPVKRIFMGSQSLVECVSIAVQDSAVLLSFQEGLVPAPDHQLLYTKSFSVGSQVNFTTLVGSQGEQSRYSFGLFFCPDHFCERIHA